MTLNLLFHKPRTLNLFFDKAKNLNLFFHKPETINLFFRALIRFSRSASLIEDLPPALLEAPRRREFIYLFFGLRMSNLLSCFICFFLCSFLVKCWVF